MWFATFFSVILHIIKANIFLGLIEYELNSLLGASHLADYISVHIRFDLERYLLNEKLAAHGSLEDVKALKRVFLHPLCSRELYNEVISNSRQLSSIRRKASFDKSTKISEQKISSFLKLNHQAKKLAKPGFTSEADLKNIWSKFGAELCIAFFVSKGPGTKLPRITGDVQKLCNIQRILQDTT